MFKFLILATLFLASNAYVLPPVPKDVRIINGSPADILEAPYQASILIDYFDIGSYISVCGGAVLSHRVVLSAAHCPYDTDVSQWKVRTGSNFSEYGGQTRTVPKIIYHPDYNNDIYDYDICLFFLSSALTIDGINTAIVPLPAQSQEVEDGVNVFIVGWGLTAENGFPSSFLRKLIVPVVNQEVCKNAYIDYKPVNERMVCAGDMEGSKGICIGDSGGPMMVNGVVIGVASWGLGCARSGYPGVFTRVPYFREWIDAEMI